MGCEAEEEAEKKQGSTPRLLFSVSPLILRSPEAERSGMLTPPLHSSGAAVPFRWEQEPGKPRPCTSLVPFSDSGDLLPKCLELPPRLLLPSPLEAEGPYVGSNSNRFRPPSFRVSKDFCGGSSSSSERGLLGAMVLSKGGEGKKGKWWWFGSNWRKNRQVINGGSHVFPSSAERERDNGTHKKKVSMSKMKHSGSFSTLSSHGKSRIWTTICEGLKQVVPWRSTKLKKNRSGLKL